MMIREFKKLAPHEAEFMFKAPVLVCILIAGADGKIDQKEIREALTIAGKKKESKGILFDYFQVVFDDFEDKLKIAIQNYPFEAAQRNPIITEELAVLNTVWSRLNPEFSVPFYEMLLDLAKRIASSSGGWLGIKSISPQEAKFITLPMISHPSKI
jgi:hypothetical protein